MTPRMAFGFALLVSSFLLGVGWAELGDFWRAVKLSAAALAMLSVMGLGAWLLFADPTLRPKP